jgi:hypothetical protein
MTHPPLYAAPSPDLQRRLDRLHHHGYTIHRRQTHMGEAWTFDQSPGGSFDRNLLKVVTEAERCLEREVLRARELLAAVDFYESF